MNALSLTPLALLLLPAAPAERAVNLRWAPQAGSAFTKTFASTMDLEGGDLEVIMDGQEIPPEFLPELLLEAVSESRVVLTDRVRGVADGRPAELLRTFDELEERSEESSEMIGFEGGDVSEEGSNVGSSGLEGSTVRFLWDDEEGEYQVDYAGDEDGDPNLLEGLVEDADLRDLLPDGPVELGDRWTPSAEALFPVFAPGGDLGWTYDGDGSLAESATPEEIELSGELTLKLTGFHDSDGARIADVSIEGEVTLKTVTPSNLDRVPVIDGAATMTQTAIYELEGELAWNVSAGYLAGLELEGDVTSVASLVRDPSEPGQTFESTVHLEGTATFTIEVESAD